MRQVRAWWCVPVVVLFAATAHADTTTIDQLVTVAGAPTNQLYGYGLVVGLPGTGDQTTEVPYTQQSILNMLRNMGISLPNVTSMQPNDVASVMVTAEVPAFAHAGQRVDVTVSAVGNAASLAGGVLLPTPMRGGNGVVYAQAQGPLLVSGFASSAGGTSTSVNVPTVGALPGGAMLANTIPADYTVNGTSALLLDTPSFQTAQQITDVINACLLYTSFGGHPPRLLYSNRSWSFLMTMQTALSGLTGAQTGLNTVSNDLANASTTAFKSQSALFEDIYPAGAGKLPGIGTGLEGISSDPVSYTHLDVYKRQFYHAAGGDALSCA